MPLAEGEKLIFAISKYAGGRLGECLTASVKRLLAFDVSA